MAALETFISRDDLKKFGDNGILLYALDLRFSVSDIDSVAAESLTDGSDDKKCDLVYIDKDNELAVIAQGYYSSKKPKLAKGAKSGKKARLTAPANKASDLNTAVGWLLSRDIKELPERLRNPATVLRAAIADRQIKSIQAWYVHNLSNSANVRSELKTVERTLKNCLKTDFPEAGVEDLAAIEVGRETLDEWYHALTSPILVTDQFKMQVDAVYESKGDNWAAVVTSVPLNWLWEIYRKHKDELFSANVRGYLGSRQSDANINNGIKETAKSDATHFWVFNNGLTVLVNDYKLSNENKGKRELKLSGLSIVNGAQTTGAIGSLKTRPMDAGWVQARFVKCKDQETITDIIKFNNSQNKVQAADFRSNDPVQDRLRDEFEKIPDAEYLGGRRGGADDKIKRPQNVLASDTVAQALAAFHQNVITAYNRKRWIWEDDKYYRQVFTERTHAIHIVFVYSLLKQIEAKKIELKAKQAAMTLTAAETRQFAFLRLRGSSYLLTAAIANCLETFAGKPIPDTFNVSFGKNMGPGASQKIWGPIVDVAMAFTDQLLPAVENGLNSAETAKECVDKFKTMIEATRLPNEATYNKYAKRLAIA